MTIINIQLTGLTAFSRKTKKNHWLKLKTLNEVSKTKKNEETKKKRKQAIDSHIIGANCADKVYLTSLLSGIRLKRY